MKKTKTTTSDTTVPEKTSKRTRKPSAKKAPPKMGKVSVIGVASGVGALNPECQDGPDVLRSFGFMQDLGNAGDDFHWETTIHLNQQEGSPADAVAAVARELSHQVTSCMQRDQFPLVIGGDHSCAIGTWTGVRDAVAKVVPKDNEGETRLGLIWFDAHMDAHTPKTSITHAVDGMPLACLLGFGDGKLTALNDPEHAATRAPVLNPEDVCLIGVRSFEWAEASLLKQLGVRVYFMDEIERRGLAAVVREALMRVRQETVGYGVSIDLDVLDPGEESGVGTPVPGGIALYDMLEALAWVRATGGLLALEITEYNPYLDHHFDTATAVADLARSIVGAEP